MMIALYLGVFGKGFFLTATVRKIQLHIKWGKGGRGTKGWIDGGRVEEGRGNGEEEG